jgi:N-acyl-D-amino-acid deacylase
MDAGLCGFSIQRLGRNSTQADFDGTPMVTDTMVDEDILALAEVLAERDEGFIQITQATGHIKDDLKFVEKLAEVAQRPVIHNAIAPTRRNPEPHRKSLNWLQKCWEQGLPVYGQAAIGRAGFAFTLENWNLYDFSKAWRALTTGSHDEKLAKMADPELRGAMVEAETRNYARYRKLRPGVGGPLEELIVSSVPGRPELEFYVGRALKDIAADEGRHAGEVMLDLSLATDLQAEFLGPDKGSNPDFMGEIMNESPYTVPGVSDGGAHTKFFTGGAWTTDFLAWMVRDEKKLTVEEAHYRMSALAAHAAGFRDRGVLREGAPADVIVYDMDDLSIEPEWVGEAVYDLPGGEWRRVQKAHGYRHILVNGVETFTDGECTGETPGKLLRHGKAS